MTSSRPYLIRAMYEWIIDNKLTPYIVVNAEHDGVQVPTDYIEEGKIILNVSPSACRGLHMENDRIVFSARFRGEAQQIFTPPSAVLAIYAKENGRGMVFGTEDEGDGVETDNDNPPPTTTTPKGDELAARRVKKGKLRVVK